MTTIIVSGIALIYIICMWIVTKKIQEENSNEEE
jgi:hypothetical protein